MTGTVTTDNKSTLLYWFLVSPEFRWARYLVLIMTLIIISFSQVFIIFLDYRDILGGRIHIFTFLYLLTYTGVTYLNLFWLSPKFSLERRCLTCVSLLSIVMVLTLAIQMVTEYISYSYRPEFYERVPYFSMSIMMDCTSSFMLSTLCMIGGTMTTLLKEWMIDHQRVSQMEKVHVLSEVEQPEEQISPGLLFRTLHHSGELTSSGPKKAPKMPMKLGQLLRYRSYDCGRTRVLFGSEVNLLNNYLTLEQSFQAQFNHEPLADGGVNRTLVPPLLFIPFIQYIVKSINGQRTSIPISFKVRLKVEENIVIFTCLCPQVNSLEDKRLEKICQRPNLLYGNRYRLFLMAESI